MCISNENSDQEKALFRLYAIEKTDIKSADKRQNLLIL